MSKQIDFNPGGYMLGNQFVVHPSTNQIVDCYGSQMGNPTKIEPKVMEVLQLLASYAGTVVKKTQLVAQVWGEYGGGEDALVQAISKLRKVFGDNAKNPMVIETIPKKGYRLLLKINKLPQMMADLPGNNRAPASMIKRSLIMDFMLFVEKLTEPRFFLAFFVLSLVLLAALGIVYQIVFWLAIM